MLAKTSDVLERAGVSSLKQLRQMLYGELGGATTADVLNLAIGDLFASASKCISMATNNGNATDRELIREEVKLLSEDGLQPSDETMNNAYFMGRLSHKPQFVKIGEDDAKPRFVKTLLGEMLGDIFAVQGIYAGADGMLEFPLASVLGVSATSFGLSTPLLSVMMLGWAGEERENNSLSGFAADGKLPHDKGPPRNYVWLEHRLAKRARVLKDKDFLVYRSQPVGSKILYGVNGKVLSPEDVPRKVSGLSIGIDAAMAIFKYLRDRDASADEISGRLFYGNRYTQNILRWMADNGYIEILDGAPHDKRSEMLATTRAYRLLEYLSRPLSILDFNPKTNPARVWKRPRIDVGGLVRYRESLIDPFHTDPNSRAAFEAACRTAYQRHFAYLGRNRKNHT